MGIKENLDRPIEHCWIALDTATTLCAKCKAQRKWNPATGVWDYSSGDPDHCPGPLAAEDALALIREISEMATARHTPE